MSLIKCLDCQKEISQRAQSCPHCGGLTRGGTAKEWFSGAIKGLVLAAALKYLFAG